MPGLEMIGRGDAVARIAGHIADRTAFVAIVPPGLVDTVSDVLRDVPDWVAYLDNGTEIVLLTNDPTHLFVIDLLARPAVVVEVPKTVPARILSKALNQEIPDDGSRDLLICHEGEDKPMAWPTLFVDALQRVDPRAAAEIRLNSWGHMS